MNVEGLSPQGRDIIATSNLDLDVMHGVAMNLSRRPFNQARCRMNCHARRLIG